MRGGWALSAGGSVKIAAGTPGRAAGLALASCGVAARASRAAIRIARFIQNPPGHWGDKTTVGGEVLQSAVAADGTLQLQPVDLGRRAAEQGRLLVEGIAGGDA